MKEITKEELKKLHYEGRGRSNFIKNCSKISIGKIVFLPKEEWDSYGYSKKSNPSSLLQSSCYSNRKHHCSRTVNIKFSCHKYAEGWSIERIK
jgi:hypothetical protein